MWYVATPDDLTATFNQTHITGNHPSKGTYQFCYNDKSSNKNPSYLNDQNVTEAYTANYFYALTLDENDQYDAKKYFYNEVKDKVGTTPPHLFDPESLYRAETAYSGNLVVMQRFYQLPFAVDLHFGYRNESFSKADMNYKQTSNSLEQAEKNFQDDFEAVFVQGALSKPSEEKKEEQGIVEEKLRQYNGKQ